MTYYQVWLSAEDEQQAQTVLQSLVKKKLIVGGTILSGHSLFWWKGKEHEMKEYSYVMGFTITTHKEAIEKAFAEVSEEDIPMASFIPMEGNDAFLSYIKENVT